MLDIHVSIIVSGNTFTIIVIAQLFVINHLIKIFNA